MSGRLLTLTEDRWLAQAFLRGKRFPADGRTPPHRWQILDTTALTDQDGITRLILTLDVGPHSGGWWRNSQYERCWHLSISMRSTLESAAEAPTNPEVEAWGKAVFGDNLSKTWLEPPARDGDPYRPQGKAVVHIRLFVDENYQPIQPTGEVYTLVPFADGSSPEKVFR